MPPSFDTIVRNFLEQDNGAIVQITGDVTFTRALRHIISRMFGLKGDMLSTFSSFADGLSRCRELQEAERPTIVLIERMLNERPSTDQLITLKQELPDTTVIMLTWEATQETVAYFFELGVSRVLLKPASADQIIRELALAISPPGELKNQMKRCEELLREGNYDEALEISDRILLVKPNSARGLALRGDALMGIGEEDKAIRQYMTAHEARPMFMAPLLRLASAFRDMEDERALDYLMTLDEISPLNPERKIDIAEQYLLRDDHEEAEVYMDQGVEAAEREALSMVGDLTMRIVDAVTGTAPHLAKKYLQRVIDSQRVVGLDALVHYNRLGMLLRGEGKWDEAIDVYAKALEISPDDPAILYNMGLAYWEGGKRNQALQSFEQALAIDPEFHQGSVGATLNIGLLYLDMRMYRDAEPFFQHVLELDPNNTTARKRLRMVKERLAA
ncbi:Photosystem I assembly protein Ycf3 [Pseudodesulfovibrio profundus]|uniref:Photosystem I assembly protein Ycf3 n=1 Tax=Pseudodesulfovibrio profundus TaxID=57320 RepID=A0A2C8F8T2_9BACT|nr:response regulator [Pseudodesulfovibrio profundus]SOB58450.1 Photosystem I assembly protein Ycf3 [Pseudodesulfovibrio profundus]